ALTEQRVRAMAAHEQPEARLAAVAILPDDQLRPVPATPQRRRQTEEVVAGMCPDGGEADARQLGAKRGEESVERRAAVGEEVLEVHALAAEAIEKRRHADAANRLVEEPPIQSLDEDHQHVGPTTVGSVEPDAGWAGGGMDERVS